MLAGVIEKLPCGVTVPLLWLQGRVTAPLLIFAGIDIAWGVLFTIAWMRTPRA
jgi:hypothetical protein